MTDVRRRDTIRTNVRQTPVAPRALTARGSKRKLRLILRHAAQIFAERGYEGASIRDISRATGLSLSSLYYYFESKQRLLYLIQIHAFTSIIEELERRLAEAVDPETRLSVLIRNHIEYFLAHPAEMKVLSHEEDALEEPFKREVAAIKRRYYSLARGIFEELSQHGKTDGLNPRIAILSLYGMMNWIYKWHNPKVDPQAEELAGSMARIFLRGVLAAGDARASRSDSEALPVERIEAVK